MRVLLIDNYDSFTYNLVQYLGELGCHLEVFRNDAVTVSRIVQAAPDRIVLSPGPGAPEEAGVCSRVVEELSGRIPILGVCLGHQVIGQVFGARVGQASELKHGKTSLVHHDSDTLYAGVPNPFVATRYHSLVVHREGLPESLVKNAWTEEGVIMGLRHRHLAVFGVQFHPESILTTAGKQILENFLCLPA